MKFPENLYPCLQYLCKRNQEPDLFFDHEYNITVHLIYIQLSSMLALPLLLTSSGQLVTTGQDSYQNEEIKEGRKNKDLIYH